MKEKELDRALEAFDYSQLSNVRESLLTELLQKRGEDRMKAVSSNLRSSILKAKRLSLTEMDMAAAAGKPIGIDEIRDREAKGPKGKA